MSRQAQRTRMLEAATADLIGFPDHPYGYGYMQGAISSAIMQLEHGSTDDAMATLRRALGRSEQPFVRRAA